MPRLGATSAPSTPSPLGAHVAPVQLDHASRLLNHGPTVIVSAEHGGRRNLMSAAWSTPVEFSPPRLVVVVDKQTCTRGLIEASGRFALALPCTANADACYTVGSVSGAPEATPDDPRDKFERYGLTAVPGPALGLPLLVGCVAWLECRLLPEPAAQQAYDCLFGEVVSAQADTRVFTRGRWDFRDDNTALHTLHHLGAGHFVRPAAGVQGRILPVRGSTGD